jgi:hypothetical protein
MQRKISSSGEPGAPRVLCVYNREDGVFEIVDAAHRAGREFDRSIVLNEFIPPEPEDWRDRVRAAAAWILSDFLFGFVSCAVSMNPHLFQMMYDLDQHIVRPEKRPPPDEKS